MTIDQRPEPTSHCINRPIDWSGPFYSRACIDPFSSARRNGDEEVEQIKITDIAGLTDATRRHDLAETTEFATDLAYLAFTEGISSGDTEKYLTIALKAVAERLDDPNLSPSTRLSAKARQLDLISMKALEDYSTKVVGATEKQVKELKESLNGRVKDCILDAAEALEVAQGELARLEGNNRQWAVEERKMLVGKMFELLAITVRRSKIEQEQVEDEVLVVGASAFQDGPAIVFTPSHNFDYLVLSVAGCVQEVVQCKTGESRLEYHEMIKPLSGQSFSRFLEDPKRFTDAIRIITANSPDGNEAIMREAAGRIDSLFKTDQKKVGNGVTRHLVSVPKR